VTPSDGAFSSTSLHDAVQQVLAQQASSIPDHHGFAAMVDLNGAHAGIATRVGDGWMFNADGGYDWQGEHTGWKAGLNIGKTW
jgi:hypothetical protein